MTNNMKQDAGPNEASIDEQLIAQAINDENALPEALEGLRKLFEEKSAVSQPLDEAVMTFDQFANILVPYLSDLLTRTFAHALHTAEHLHAMTLNSIVERYNNKHANGAMTMVAAIMRQLNLETLSLDDATIIEAWIGASLTMEFDPERKVYTFTRIANPEAVH